jgi:arylsulfatase A-like enzyme
MAAGLVAVAMAANTILEQLERPPQRAKEVESYTTRMPETGESPGPDVVVIVIDATRRDALSPYGGVADDRTPNIARLAREGVVFDACYSAAAFSGPSYASLLTGRYPPGHGVFNHPNVLPADNRTLLEIAADAGYYTLHLVQHPYLRQQWQYDQGAVHYRYDHDHVLVDGLTSWIADNPGVPYVAFLVVTTPHYPYGLDKKQQSDLFDGLSLWERFLHNVSEPKQRMFDFGATRLSNAYVEAQRESYQREVDGVDRLIGRVLDGVRDAGRDTVVFLTADHGEAFGEHGHHFGHDVVVHAPVTGVPLIVSWPGQWSPRRIDAPVSLVDVLPTIVDVLDDDGDDGFDGRSLVELLEGRELPERAVFSYNRVFSKKVRNTYPPLLEVYQLDGYAGCSFLGARGKWDVVLRPVTTGFEYELFERAHDPLHLANLWSGSDVDPEVRQLVAEIHAYRDGFLEKATPTEGPLTKRQRKQLEALGYVE